MVLNIIGSFWHWCACCVLVLLFASCTADTSEGVGLSSDSAVTESRAPSVPPYAGEGGTVPSPNILDSSSSTMLEDFSTTTSSSGAESRNRITSTDDLENASEGELGLDEVLSDEDVSKLTQFFEMMIAGLLTRPDYSSDSDEYIVAMAFHKRALLEEDPYGIDDNDLSSPMGAFCWVVLKINLAMHTMRAGPWSPFGGYANLRLWYVEEEASDRGLELSWETGSVDIPTLRRVLSQTTSPKVRDLVLDSKLPSNLHSIAQDLYALLDELLELPLVRIRPTVEDLLDSYGIVEDLFDSRGLPYRGLEGITEEEIIEIWSEEFEVELNYDAYERYERWSEGIEREGIRDLLNDECKQLTTAGLYENACPSWVSEVLPTDCRIPEKEPRYGCPFGGCETEGEVGGASADEPQESVLSVLSVESIERMRRVFGDEGLSELVEEADSLKADGSLLQAEGMVFAKLAGTDGHFTEEGLGWLAYKYNLSDVLLIAQNFFEDQLLVSAELVRDNVKELFEGNRNSGYSDGEVKAWAYYERTEAEWDRDQFGINDRSTSLGAFCWAVLHVQSVLRLRDTAKLTPEQATNLKVWHLEREASKRGIELSWETDPVDGDDVLRRALLEVTAPEVKGVVFGPGLPSALRPGAEGLYGFYDELLALPIYRVRPTVEELAGYRRVRDLTEEGIAEIWPEEFEIRLRDADWAKVEEARKALLRDEEVRGLLNAECKKRQTSDLVEKSCPDWVAELVPICGLHGFLSELENIFACPIFYSERVVGDSGEGSSECELLVSEDEYANYIRNLVGGESAPSPDSSGTTGASAVYAGSGGVSSGEPQREVLSVECLGLDGVLSVECLGLECVLNMKGLGRLRRVLHYEGLTVLLEVGKVRWEDGYVDAGVPSDFGVLLGWLVGKDGFLSGADLWWLAYSVDWEDALEFAYIVDWESFLQKLNPCSAVRGDSEVSETAPSPAPSSAGVVPDVSGRGGNDAGAVSGGTPRSGVLSMECLGLEGVLSVECLGLEGVLSVEGLGRLWRVLGDEGLESLLEAAALLKADGYLDMGIPLESDVGVLLGRLAGEGGFLSEADLWWLSSAFSWRDLLEFAYICDEECLLEFAESMRIGPEGFRVRLVRDGRGVGYNYGEVSHEEVSYEEVEAWAYYERARVEWDRDQFDVNDRSTALGAFCWAVLRVQFALSWYTRSFSLRETANLFVWHWEREASKRGIELPWVRGPVDGNVVLRRVILDVTAPEVRGVVFGPGLPSVLRPAAELIYGVYDELLALPVYRVRPTIDELSGYRHVSDLTEEGIAEIWPEEFEVELGDYGLGDVMFAVWGFLGADDEIRGLLNAECGRRPVSDLMESACPAWVAELVNYCYGHRRVSEQESVFSCPIFLSKEAILLRTDWLGLGQIYVAGIYDECVLLVSEDELKDFIKDDIRSWGGDGNVVEATKLWRYFGEFSELWRGSGDE